jgi:hypothetical protein
MMRYGLTMGIAALAAWLLIVPAGAQKVAPGAVLDEITPRYVEIPRDQLRVERRYPLNQFFPAGAQSPPYIYLSGNWAYPAPSGAVGVAFFNPGDLATNEWADDVILAGIQSFLPVAHPNSAACLREIWVGVYLGSPSGVDVTMRIRIYGWDGSVATTAQFPDPLNATGNLIWDSGDTPINYGPLNAGIYLLGVTLADPGVTLSKAIYVSIQIDGLPTNGGLIISHGPGNIYLMPSRGDFRRKTPAGRFGFTTAVQGSFFIALRGTHNFVGQLDLGGLDDRAKPRDPILQWFDDVSYTDPDGSGVQEALRRNLVDVTLTNDSGGFSSRFTTYIDENGRFTLPVDAAISQIKVRRWDNALAATFTRPAAGWSTDPCNPTDAGSVTVPFGDVNGDGTIDDGDLLAVLFNFGAGE